MAFLLFAEKYELYRKYSPGKALIMNNNNRVKLCFFDDFWLKYKSSTMRRWFTPQYFSHYCDSAFGGMHYSSLIPDKESGQYRLYYCGFDPLSEKACFIALSESGDLKSFEPVKIKQGTSKYPAHVIDIKDRGVDVCEDGVSGVAIYDKFESDPSRRYKLMCYLRDEKGWKPGDIQVGFSADGLHWEIQRDMVVGLNSHSDTLNRLYYNPYTKEYGLIHRSTHVDRRVALKTTKDFKKWNPSKLILHPGSRYNSDDSITELYGMTAAWHDGIFLGITWPFHMKFYETIQTKMNGFIESEFVYSYDGEHFMETTNRPLVERPNPPLQGCAQTAFTDISESLDGSEYILTAWANNVHHSSAVPEMIELQDGRAFGSAFYKIRKDGFCGLEGMGGGAPGVVVTRGLQILKDDLTLNVNASCGIARFGIMIEDVVPPSEHEQQRLHPHSNLVFYEGFSFDDCVPFTKSDSVDLVPQWKEHTLQELVGKRAYIAVELKCAILHAMTFTAQQEF
jgi:hypothetical protein